MRDGASPERRAYAEVAATCTGSNIRKASRAVTQLYDDVLAPSGLRGTQFSLLVALAMVDAPTMTVLGRELVMDRSTLTRNLKPLRDADLVTVAAGEDRRARRVALTDRGREVLATALPLWRQAQARVVDGLGHERWRRLLADLSETVDVVRST
jgi:DNA-binding MarR family transcriptional regulator